METRPRTRGAGNVSSAKGVEVISSVCTSMSRGKATES